ncbi:MAG: hypothetical protein HYU51_10450 [Candidatus Rokubacteria bacterium]|nr:hypothetical protein [Candidatus Rokubacteria bacterium]
MDEFMRSYGLWIVLAGVFLAMHWFGAGCGSAHRRERQAPGTGLDGPHDGELDGADGDPARAATTPEARARSARSGGCH